MRIPTAFIRPDLALVTFRANRQERSVMEFRLLENIIDLYHWTPDGLLRGENCQWLMAIVGYRRLLLSIDIY